MRLFLAAALLSTVGLNASPAAAASPTVVKLELNGHTVTVQTSTGHTLRLAVAAFKDITEGDKSKAAINVTLSTGKAVSFGETHRWSFPAPRSAFVFHRHTGKAVLASGAALGDFGSLDLTFHKRDRVVEQCGLGGTETAYIGVLHGAVHFRSSSPWGRVNDRDLSFTSHNEVVIDRSCEEAEDEEEEAVCHNSITWVGPSATVPGGLTTQYGSAFFSGGPTRPRITGVRTINLPAPQGAGRADYLVAESAAPQLAGNTLTIDTKPGTTISGSATISGGQPSPTVTSDCTDESTNTVKEETTSGYFGASWSSPADQLLTFDFAAAADFVTPGSGSASWTESTFS